MTACPIDNIPPPPSLIINRCDPVALLSYSAPGETIGPNLAAMRARFSHFLYFDSGFFVCSSRTRKNQLSSPVALYLMPTPHSLSHRGIVPSHRMNYGLKQYQSIRD